MAAQADNRTQLAADEIRTVTSCVRARMLVVFNGRIFQIIIRHLSLLLTDVRTQYSRPENQGTETVNSPGLVTWITPAHMHISVHVLSSVGFPPRVTVAAPGTHGDVVTGMQGIGVSTPSAAAVAAATDGFAGDMHMPNDMMFTIGTWSMMFASGWFPVLTRFTGSTTRLLGAIPMAHCSVAPLQTCCGMWIHQVEIRNVKLLLFTPVSACIKHSLTKSADLSHFITMAWIRPSAKAADARIRPQSGSEPRAPLPPQPVAALQRSRQPERRTCLREPCARLCLRTGEPA